MKKNLTTAYQKKHRHLALKAARESIVLLKNKDNFLPLKKNIKTIAVVGSDATEARLGGYSGSGNSKVNILQGIKKMADKSISVRYANGSSRDSSSFVTISPSFLYHIVDGKLNNGLLGEYFNNIELQGEPDLIRVDPNINFSWTLFSPDQEKINYDYYSVKWTGKLIAPVSGEFEIGILGDDGYRLYINNKLIIDNWKKQTNQLITNNYMFQKDDVYDIKVEFFETVGNVRLSLVWNFGTQKNWKNEIKKAVKLAKQSDVTIAVVGIEEGEFRDRAYLSLPGHQEELIKALSATGKPVVVVLIGGSAITMENWKNDVNAIIEAWYPGEEGGNAVADVLFGEYNPAGRLPITFPIHESQLPLYYNHKPTGRGDDYNNLTGKPLFPFGFGLSYSTFEYSNIKIDKPEIGINESTYVRFKLKNTGKYDGDEVVQLYIKDILASVARPVMELSGFQRVHIRKNESIELSFEITPDMLSMLDENMIKVVEPGEFRVMIGASSIDIRLREILTVK